MEFAKKLRNGVTAGVATLALVGTFAVASPAAASTPTEQAQADRVIDLSDQTAPVPANRPNVLTTETAEAATDVPVTTAGVIPLPAGVRLQSGEVVQVNYADGVVVHTALAAGCTQSAYAGVPYRTSAAQARSAHSYSISSGCTGTHGSQSVLTSLAWPWWHQRAWNRVQVNPGNAVNWHTTKACTDNGSHQWRSETGKGAHILAQSNPVTINCKVY